MGKKYKTDKERFAELLGKYPRLAGYWDLTNADPRNWECDLDRVRATGGALSRAEGVLLNCLISIWLGGAKGEWEVDFTDLYAVLDPHYRNPLLAWLAEPYWP
jgi:hypothetical protein